MSTTICCPKCGKDYGADMSPWDYKSFFEVECICGIMFEVEVEPIPEFYCRAASPRDTKEGMR